MLLMLINLSKCSHLFFTFCVFVVIFQEKNWLILVIFGTVIKYHVLVIYVNSKIAFGAMPNLSNYGNIMSSPRLGRRGTLDLLWIPVTQMCVCPRLSVPDFVYMIFPIVFH